MPLYFVTSNENKVKESERILGLEIDKLPLDIKEIQTLEVEEVAEDKAKRAFEQIKKPVAAEDTGFYLEAWNGFPGALIKWVLEALGNEGLCRAFQETNRTVKVKTCICLYNAREIKTFCGEVKGKIPAKPKGERGFGWDSIFQPDGYEKTFAEMSPEEKDSISMRKLALVKMKEFLDRNPDFLS
jgi:XTP/dITP diphosphohydrolase